MQNRLRNTIQLGRLQDNWYVSSLANYPHENGAK